MENELLTIVLGLLGTSLLSGIGAVFIIIKKKLANSFLNKIIGVFSRHHKHEKYKRQDIEKDNKIREILIELRTLTNSDRACLFQFHNGAVFSTKNPIWKVSNTHETVSTGIASEIGKLQDIKASSISDNLSMFWKEGDIPKGIEKISPEYCKTCPNSDGNAHKNILFIDVKYLEDGYSKSLLIEQGIRYAINIPVYNTEDNIIGFVAINYCSEQYDIEDIKLYASTVCKYTSQIQFMLLN